MGGPDRGDEPVCYRVDVCAAAVLSGAVAIPVSHSASRKRRQENKRDFIANVGISYIRSKLSLRASFNYRGRYLTGFNANESRATYAHARPVVDIKTLYNVSRTLSVYLDVVNVLMNPDRQTEFGYGRPQTTHLMRPQFFFGVNARK